MNENGAFKACSQSLRVFHAQLHSWITIVIFSLNDSRLNIVQAWIIVDENRYGDERMNESIELARQELPVN